MQIQSWEGAALSGAETVLQGTTQDTLGAEVGHGEKVSRRRWLKKLEEGIDWASRHSRAERPEGRRVFELERVVSCRSADRWWRTKLDFGSGDFAAGEVLLAASERAEASLAELPAVIIAIVPHYHLLVPHQDLQFTGELLAEIFLGEVKKWNDPQITKLNPNASLPDMPIKVFYRPRGERNQLHLLGLPLQDQLEIPHAHRNQPIAEVAGW
jgi:hypothetical protein